MFSDALLVALALSVALLVFPLLAEEVSVEAEVFTLLDCCALFAAEAAVVALVLLALFEAEDVSVVDALLLALSCSAAFLFELALFVELLAVELVDVLVSPLLEIGRAHV